MSVEEHLGFTGNHRAELSPAQADMLAYFFNSRSGWLHHGDCIMADAAAHVIAKIARLKVAIHPPINPKKRAFCTDADLMLPEKDYIPRNHDIVDAVVELFACPFGMTEERRSGTWATIRYARQRRRMVTIIYPNGSVEFSP